MFGVGLFEMIFIGIVALVVVGPKRLPEVMKQAGRLFVHLRRTANDVRSTFDQVIRDAENDMRREEVASLRDALKPVSNLHAEVKALVAGAASPNAPIATAVHPAETPAPVGAAPYSPPAPASASPEAPPSVNAEASEPKETV